jgi:hypothetical protein
MTENPPHNLISVRNLKQLRNYWIGLRGSRPMPKPDNFSLVDMPPEFLPVVALADVFYDPLEFQYRYVGENIVKLSGRDATGLKLDEKLYGNNTQRMLWAFNACVEQKTPVAVRERIQVISTAWFTVEVILLPLGDANGKVSRILSGLEKSSVLPEKKQGNNRLVLDWKA